MGRATHWVKGSALSGPPADAHTDDLPSVINRLDIAPVFEQNVARVMQIIYDMALPSDVSRRRCEEIDGLEHYSLVVIQTAAARVKIEHELLKKPVAPAKPLVALLTAAGVSRRIDALGLTRRAFAFECDMLPSLLSAYLNGSRVMGQAVKAQILEALLRLEGTLR